MDRKQVITTRSFEETQKLGENFGVSLSVNNVFALYGELGSGKTTFVQGLAKGLGIKRRIISPTFIIVRSYRINLKTSLPRQAKWGGQISKLKTITQKLKSFYHIDLYRIESIKDIEELGIIEAINNKENAVAIEWAEKLDKLLPKRRTDIYFKYLSENKRQIKIAYFK